MSNYRLLKEGEGHYNLGDVYSLEEARKIQKENEGYIIFKQVSKDDESLEEEEVKDKQI